MFRSFANPRPTIPVWIALALIAATGATMRLYGLSNQSFWFDEVCSWHTATQPTLAGVWSGDIQWNMYPPLYGFVLRAAIAVFGDAEWAMRLPSALAGIAAIPLMYFVAARIYGDAEGLIAAGFTAASMFPLYFAQEARPYALLLSSVLLTVLAWTYMFEAWAHDRAAPRLAVVVGFAASVCTAYLHYFGLLFIALLGSITFVLFAGNRFGLLRSVTFYVATAVAFGPWLPFMAWHLRHQSEGPQNPPLDPNAFASAGAYIKSVFVAYWDYINSLFNHGQTASTLASAITAIALLLVLVALVRDTVRTDAADPAPGEKRMRLTRNAVLLAWILLPLLIAYLKSSVSASVFTHRNLIVSLPAVYLLAARGITRLPLPRVADAALAAIIVVVLVARTLTSGYYTAPHKDQFREAVATVVNQEAQYPGAALVVYAQMPFTFNYYLERFHSTLRPSLVAGRAGQIDAMRKLIRDQHPSAIWYLCTEPYPDNAFVDYLNAEFKVIGMQEYLRANVMLLIPK